MIAVEGSTEKVYFESVRRFLRLKGADIAVFNPASTDPIGMGRFAKKRAKENTYDEIWIVCDLETAVSERHTQFEQCKTSPEFRGIRFIESINNEPRTLQRFFALILFLISTQVVLGMFEL